ncbi:RNA-splicing ligase RtcB [Exiguobacterium undae]|uniref:3'-phosphate/5'-hydroxy nucleic acid ligase n=1 Tax=Exiguobacterium undae TaxID=169177 RepID=A0ABX2VCB3_9BACL|nr:RNA-splicing ligase RtcB [Exiguobacterium undae]OAN15840.1 RNA-splicing ligase RtcB [Exiguobacterium undae]
MRTIRGKYGEAKIFTHNVDDMTIEQVTGMLNENIAVDGNVRIMPDCHAGKGSVIGTTMRIHDKVVPNLVGVDIGCGMLCTQINREGTAGVDYEKLDATIQALVPSGMSVRNQPHRLSEQIPFDQVLAPFNETRARLSIGTLGGGNHFIELNTDEEDNLYLVIHSGSRNLGKTIAEHYQKLAEASRFTVDTEAIVASLKDQGREQDIQTTLVELKSQFNETNKDLAYVSGSDMDNYLHDLKIAQRYAVLNRQAMTDVIVEAMGWSVTEQFDTIHNYIDLEQMILRKGAISAQAGEVAIIPMNMRDGSLIVKGKGNPDWNYSAPHGAGRIMSRSKAFKSVDLKEFEATMQDVWSSSVVESTRDESPFVYKPMEEIIRNTMDTVELLKVIKPLYNFKAK